MVNQRLELRATKTTTRDFGSWMVYMICYCCRTLQLTGRGEACTRFRTVLPVTTKCKVPSD